MLLAFGKVIPFFRFRRKGGLKKLPALCQDFGQLHKRIRITAFTSETKYICNEVHHPEAVRLWQTNCTRQKKWENRQLQNQVWCRSEEPFPHVHIILEKEQVPSARNHHSWRYHMSVLSLFYSLSDIHVL